MKRSIQTFILGALLALPLVAVPALAHEGHDHNVAVEPTTGRLTDEQKAEIRENAKKRIEGKLSDAKKEVCEKRVEVIVKIMTNAATAGARHLAVFDKILSRVTDFYADRNLSVANYDELLAATATKKEAAQAAIDAVEANTSFDCSGDNPIASINAFNGKIRTMHQALKDYRTAIKDLLVAVKQAAEATEGEES